MSLESDLLEAFEEHSPHGIRQVLRAGFSVKGLLHGKRPVDCLVEGYLRSPRFADCLRVLLDAGAEMDPLLKILLLDDQATLRRSLAQSRALPHEKLSFRSAFTSCAGVTPLHVCAEFNCLDSAKVLLEAGANVDAQASKDAEGFGGQTPLFHAVNSIMNYCRPTMELLVRSGATLDVKLKGLVWGAEQPWETLLLDVTPTSYAQCGLYAQFHRNERDVYSNLAYLYRHRYAEELSLRNVPNEYLKPRR
jgi:hypothetical protein